MNMAKADGSLWLVTCTWKKAAPEKLRAVASSRQSYQASRLYKPGCAKTNFRSMEVEEEEKHKEN